MKQLELRGILWILGVITLFMVSGMQSLKPVYTNITVHQGSTVNLTCNNKTWSEMYYTIWKIHVDMRKKKCQIDFNNDGRNQNTCEDEKKLLNTSTGESYLFIPNVSSSDEGEYNCDSAYMAGSNTIIFELSVTVPPIVSATLQWQGGRKVAVCLAERGRPAASIVWKNMGNYSSIIPKENIRHHPDGLYTVESQLDVPEGLAADILTCAIQHPFWDKEQIVIPQVSTAQSAGPWGWLLITLLAVSVIGILLGLLFFTQRNLAVIRHCWKSNTSNTTIPTEVKPPPTAEVEEVEPYASYVQRVNSIYDSSADLFT